MKKLFLFIILLLNSVGIGCKSLTRTATQSTQSRFLSQFSLQKIVGSQATRGLDCSIATEGYGMGASAGGIGFDRVSHDQSHTTVCEIKESGIFKEGEFTQLLKSEIEKQVQKTGGEIQGSGISGSKGFYIEYAEGNIHGKVEVSFQRDGRYYSVTARIEEKTK